MRNYQLPEWQPNLERLQNNFEEFLRQNNAYYAFCEEACIEIDNFGEYWNKIGNAQYYPLQWVSASFVWRLAYNGEDYWQALQAMWYEQLEQDNEL